ncbi:MAG TPA: L,D-transpeptidase [Solirubrobacterales bacterium]|nr:L,D-transpeptidase [Solirubrobacterales bacterium]
MSARTFLVSAGVVLSLILGALGPGSTRAGDLGGDELPMALPAVGRAVSPRVAVRAEPRPEAKVRAVMKALRFDYRPTVFFVNGRRDTTEGEWYRIKIPGRPNGRIGWVNASRIRLIREAGPHRIVIDRGRRRITLFRGDRAVLRSDVGVGTPDAPTPLGNFYVTAAFRPDDDFLGPWAFETSAYAAISDWPRGGIVGLHGTSMPWTVGERASHGCIRVYNKVIRALKERVRPGTEIRIRA